MKNEMMNIKRDIEMLKKAINEIKITIDIEPEIRPEYIKKLNGLEKEGKWVNLILLMN